MRVVNPNINKAALERLKEEAGVTNPMLAAALGLNSESQISRIFSGHRRLTGEEVPKLAAALAVPVSTIYECMGVTPPQIEVETDEGVPVVGTIDGSLSVRYGPVRGSQSVLFPWAGRGVEALRFACSGSSYECFHGGYVIYRRVKDAVPAGAVGRLCVVEVSAEQYALRCLGPGSAGHKFNLHGLGGGKALEANIVLHSASPVLWIKTSA